MSPKLTCKRVYANWIALHVSSRHIELFCLIFSPSPVKNLFNHLYDVRFPNQKIDNSDRTVWKKMLTNDPYTFSRHLCLLLPSKCTYDIIPCYMSSVFLKMDLSLLFTEVLICNFIGDYFNKVTVHLLSLHMFQLHVSISDLHKLFNFPDPTHSFIESEETDRQTDRQTGIQYCCSPKYSYISDIVLAFLFTVSLHSSSIAYTVFQWVLNQQNIVYLKLFRKGLENIVCICNLIHVIIELFTLVQMSSGSKFPSVNKLQVIIRFISNTLQVIVFFYC